MNESRKETTDRATLVEKNKATLHDFFSFLLTKSVYVKDRVLLSTGGKNLQFFLYQKREKNFKKNSLNKVHGFFAH